MSDEFRQKKESKAYKVTPDFKLKLETLFSESGMDTQEQFLEQLTSLYEMQLLKEGNPDYRKDLVALEHHSKRVIDIFKSMLGTEADSKAEVIEGYENKLAKCADELFRQQQETQELTKLTKEQKHQQDALQKENGDISKQVAHLEEINRKTDVLYQKAEAENAALETKIESCQVAIIEADELKRQVTVLQQLSKQQMVRIEHLEEQLIQQEQKHQEALEGSREKLAAQETRHLELMEQLREKMEMQKEREIVLHRSEHQKEITVLHENAAKKNEEYTKQVQSLYEQIHFLREGAQKDKNQS